ncbi:HmuY family protein [Formosa sp. S-31]|uniref:HmuY family protein n=1 Tax=Formosa sp. S-31 TaxID=2790949 RepID=UPI003EBADDA3
MTKRFLSIMLSITVLAFTGCSEDDSPSGPIDIVIEGANVTPEVGGPNQQNQVYIDLSTNTSTTVQRDSWDLGFYSGSEHRVIINGSIYMATAQLTTTDIDAVNKNSTEVQDLQQRVAVGTFQAESAAFIDAPDGNLSKTAIAEISETDAENHVYLVNLGFAVGTETPATGSVAINGESRGWKKIRILKRDENYLLQYADLDATSHEEVSISKNSDYNFTFFSFNSNTETSVEPAKMDWDLKFSVFTNEIPGYGAYGYSDFVVNNLNANAKIYMIDSAENTELTYDNFILADVDMNNFSDDQRGIGSSWRNGGGPSTEPSLKENLFYIVNDTDGNLYKLKFLALTNEAGERGYPQFVYSLLQ